ncbi:MAG TPA: hypothetical protein VLV86_02055 [Vicinamibacterales bacterium]|nr:hypothetical protein [Vicinamibacterales bacterium]
MKRLGLICTAAVALLATVLGHVRLQEATAAVSLVRFRQTHSVAKQLPAGLVLPSSDVDLKISTLVAADLDADGDLDIIAADPANGSVDILVWVNDGDGRLTRKRPAQPKTLGAEPGDPSVDQTRTTVIAAFQPDSPAVQTICANAWLVLPEQRCRLPLSPSAISATIAARRSRSPPALA